MKKILFFEHLLAFFRYGSLDAKIAGKESFPSLVFESVAGPTTDDHPPFDWETTNIKPIPEFRPIQKFDFKPHNHTWTMNLSGAGDIIRYDEREAFLAKLVWLIIFFFRLSWIALVASAIMGLYFH